MLKFARLSSLISFFALSAFAPAALPVNIIYTDSAGYGFRDPSLGVQRRNAFETALRTWTNQLQGTVPLAVQARFEAMGGDAYSAVLAYAGPVSIARDFPNAQPSTWYVSALANQLAGYDVDPASADIEVVINSDVDNAVVLGNVGYYYGVDGNAAGNVDFRTTILHELGHGLGFISFIDNNTGEFFRAPGDAVALPDIYSRMLSKSKKGYLSPKLKTIDRLRGKQRLKAARSRNLRWIGPAVYESQGFLGYLFAPKSFLAGSSVSHWDTLYSPDLLMEPYDTGPKFGIDLTRQALQDLGWKF
jgi:hypothetical protein